MSIKPQDYNVPDEFKHWEGDTAEDYLGPFFFQMNDGQPTTAMRIGKQHCNAHGTIHGGILMSFADYTLCLGANGGEQDSVVTVSCSNEFTAPAYEGGLLIGVGEVIRRGKSMVFMRCKLMVDEQIVLISSGVIKRLNRKVEAT